MSDSEMPVGNGSLRTFELAEVLFDASGLVPVVAQEAGSAELLMLAYANREALQLTLETGRAHYYSRSRGELWKKGETSGNIQRVLEVRLDCDGDAVVYSVIQTGPACHTGAHSCFFRSRRPEGSGLATASGQRLGRVLTLLEEVVSDRFRELPEGSYVTRLHERGRGYIAQKVVEEAGETVVAALEGKGDELTGEAADLLFHLAVLLVEGGHGLDEVAAVLEERHRMGTRSGPA